MPRLLVALCHKAAPIRLLWVPCAGKRRSGWCGPQMVWYRLADELDDPGAGVAGPGAYNSGVNLVAVVRLLRRTTAQLCCNARSSASARAMTASTTAYSASSIA